MDSNASASNSHYQVLILGGGTGGLTVAARLSKKSLKSKSGAPLKIGIVEPSETHYYQPFWTLVGGGVVKKEDSQRFTKDYIPSGVEWLKSKVLDIQPSQNQIRLSDNRWVSYDYLIVATGLVVNFDKIPGVKESLGTKGICSIYDYHQAEKTFEMLSSFKGGHAIFTMPLVPIKCAGAPQKIMYLAEELFRKNNVRTSSKVSFYSAGAAIFGVPTFAAPLMKVVERQGIETHFLLSLVSVEPENKVAVFEKLNPPGSSVIHTGELVRVNYDLIHVVPTNSPHEFITKSDLAWKEGPHKGWLKVDPFTLQSPEFKNVFGVGDVTGIPNAKTGAAIRKQAPILIDNLISAMENRPLTQKYDGYSSCPLVTSRGRVILAEFGYDGKILPSFPIDPTKERYSMWILKRYLLPKMYWNGMLRGRA